MEIGTQGRIGNTWLGGILIFFLAISVAALYLNSDHYSGSMDIPEQQPPPNAIPVPSTSVTYGPYDRSGIPLRDFSGAIGIVYHPLVVAEFGGYYYELLLSTKDDKYRRGLKKMADWLVKNMNYDGYWIYGFASSYGGVLIEPPWVSAVAQGYGAQTLLKAAAATGEMGYKRAAKKALAALAIPVDKGGVRFELERGVFFEEVAGKTPTHILNGNLRALQALHDYLTVENDAQLEELLQQGLIGLDYVLENYDTGYWSRYDLLPPMEPKVQFLVYGIKNQSKSPIEIQISTEKLQLVGVPARITAANFRVIDNSALDPAFEYYEIELRGIHTSGWAVPSAKALLTGHDTVAYLTWPENHNLLLPLNATRTSDGYSEYAIPGIHLGHPTGKSYHGMMIRQLSNLAESRNKANLQDTARRWKRYEEERLTQVR